MKRLPAAEQEGVFEKPADRLVTLDTQGGNTAKHLRGRPLVVSAKSLIGKDFRAIRQFAIFAVEPYLTQRELDMWTSWSRLASVLYVREISNMDQHLVCGAHSLFVRGGSFHRQSLHALFVLRNT